MRKKAKIFVALCVILLSVAAFFTILRGSVKYAVKIQDVGKYPNCILVREAWHTGTGWEKVGNDQGYLVNEDRKDVYLVGKLPPTASIGGEHVNTYLCEVVYMGESHFPAIGEAESFEKYEVLQWYPVYPIKRDSLLPSWFYSKEYLLYE